MSSLSLRIWVDIVGWIFLSLKNSSDCLSPLILLSAFQPSSSCSFSSPPSSRRHHIFLLHLHPSCLCNCLSSSSSLPYTKPVYIGLETSSSVTAVFYPLRESGLLFFCLLLCLCFFSVLNFGESSNFWVHLSPWAAGLSKLFVFSCCI